MHTENVGTLSAEIDGDIYMKYVSHSTKHYRSVINIATLAKSGPKQYTRTPVK